MAETNGASHNGSDELRLTDLITTTLVGMKATIQEAGKGEFTEYYPEQRPALPWGTKGQLYVDIFECISCYACAKACPSDCIRIDSVRVPPGALPDTKDGHKRMFEVIRFDIDMSQCCYCGLCTGRSSYVPADKKEDAAALAYADRTAACPTDCINFYPKYENGCEEADDLIYHFSHFDFDEAMARWNSVSADKRRTTHPGKPEADYQQAPVAPISPPEPRHA